MWLGTQSKSCPTLYLVIVSAIISGILDVCVSSSSVHDGGRVPCAELPEFAYLTNVPTIYGSCRLAGKSVVMTALHSRSSLQTNFKLLQCSSGCFNQHCFVSLPG